jgi:hypothetical protein
MTKYKRKLNVSSPDGMPVYITVIPSRDSVAIRSEVYDLIKKDNPKFSKNGAICFNCPKDKYQESVFILTKYFEDLFLKGMSNEDLHTSFGIKPVKRGNAGKDKSSKTSRIKGKGDSSSIHSSTGGTEQAESFGRKSDHINME